MLWSLPTTPMSSACLLIREVGDAETKENSQRRLNNNNVVIKLEKAESRRIDTLELWCWRRLSVGEAVSKIPSDCKEIQPVHPKGD